MHQNDKIIWVAVSVKPNQVNKAENNLSQQGFECIAPKIKVTRRQKNRFVSKVNLLFPGYIFVKINKDTRDARKVSSTYGVSNIVMNGQRIGAVPDAFINELNIMFDENKIISINTLEPGQKVEVLRGPFAGLVTQLTRVESVTRVKCLFDLISGKISASVLIDNLIVIDAEGKTSSLG